MTENDNDNDASDNDDDDDDEENDDGAGCFGLGPRATSHEPEGLSSSPVALCMSVCDAGLPCFAGLSPRLGPRCGSDASARRTTQARLVRPAIEGFPLRGRVASAASRWGSRLALCRTSRHRRGSSRNTLRAGRLARSKRLLLRAKRAAEPKGSADARRDEWRRPVSHAPGCAAASARRTTRVLLGGPANQGLLPEWTRRVGGDLFVRGTS